MSKGFGTDLARPSFSSMSEPLPRTAVSLTPAERVDNITSTLLTEAATKMQPSGPAASPAPEGGDAQVPDDRPKHPLQSPLRAPAAELLFDIRSAQSSFARSKNAVVGALSKKMQDTLAKAAAAIKTHASMGVSLTDDDEVKTVWERMQAAMLWLNMEAKLREVKDETGKAIRAKDIACSVTLCLVPEGRQWPSISSLAQRNVCLAHSGSLLGPRCHRPAGVHCLIGRWRLMFFR